jgi:hypothetical protein
MKTTSQSKCRWSFVLAAVLGTCLTEASVAAPPQALVPANFSSSYISKTDSQGYLWRIHKYGYINQGTNSCFGNAAVLTVNNNSFSSPQSTMMTPDGSEYVFSRQVSTLYVTRRVKVDMKAAAVRYVETFRNNTAATITAQVKLQTGLGRTQGQALITDRGAPAGPMLGKKDSGLILFGQPAQQQLSVLFYLGGARAKVKPTIQNQSNSQIMVNYTITVEAGKEVSIIHGLAQRRLASIPNAKQAKALFKPFFARSWTRGLPSAVRRTIINLGGFSFGGFGDGESLLTLESLGIDRQATDIFAIGEETRLHGTATCKTLAISTEYGLLKLPLEKVAAIVGERFTGGKPRVFLIDGQVLNGSIAIDGLQFVMNSGLRLELEAKNIDRLLMRVSEEDGKPAEEVVTMLETTSGDRLAMLQAEDQLVSLTTPWGRRRIPLDEIQRMFLSEEKIGHHVVLRDGNRLFGFVSGSTLSLKTMFFGEQKFMPARVRLMAAAHRPSSEQEMDGELAVSHLLLVGDNVMVGQIDLEAIHFVTAGNQIPVPPNQIRVLRNTSGEIDESSDVAVQFEGELWDGGVISGELAELVLPIRSADVIAQVPLKDVREIHVPTPVVTDTMRVKVAQLIRDLGHPEYVKRKAAKDVLAGLGHLTKLQLSETLRQTSDPEVRRSVEDLLKDLD